MKLTRKQQGIYRSLISAAWLAGDFHTTPRDVWYRQQLQDATGYYSSKQFRNQQDFDTALYHFALLAGDDYWIERLADSQERRLR